MMRSKALSTTIRIALIAGLAAMAVASLPLESHARQKRLDVEDGTCRLADGTFIQEGDTYYDFEDECSGVSYTCLGGEVCVSEFKCGEAESDGCYPALAWDSGARFVRLPLAPSHPSLNDTAIRSDRNSLY
jgi:hypothetical protein